MHPRTLTAGVRSARGDAASGLDGTDVDRAFIDGTNVDRAFIDGRDGPGSVDRAFIDGTDVDRAFIDGRDGPGSVDRDGPSLDDTCFPSAGRARCSQ